MKIKNFQTKKANILKILIGSNNKGKIKEIRGLIPNKVKILGTKYLIYQSIAGAILHYKRTLRAQPIQSTYRIKKYNVLVQVKCIILDVLLNCIKKVSL